jgi:hypothetical protein
VINEQRKCHDTGDSVSRGLIRIQAERIAPAVALITRLKANCFGAICIRKRLALPSMSSAPSVPAEIRSYPACSNLLQRGNVAGEGSVKNRELSLIQGFWLCLRDSEAVRLQSSRWKRNLLVFSSGVCLEIALLPLLVGSDGSWQRWILPTLFVPLGLLGLYASKFGNDRLVEKLLVIPKLDLRI